MQAPRRRDLFGLCVIIMYVQSPTVKQPFTSSSQITFQPQTTSGCSERSTHEIRSTLSSTLPYSTPARPGELFGKPVYRYYISISSYLDAEPSPFLSLSPRYLSGYQFPETRVSDNMATTASARPAGAEAQSYASTSSAHSHPFIVSCG